MIYYDKNGVVIRHGDRVQISGDSELTGIVSHIYHPDDSEAPDFDEFGIAELKVTMDFLPITGHVCHPVPAACEVLNGY